MTTNPPELELEDATLSLHDEYHLAKQCGYDIDLQLSKFEVQDIAMHLRGISSIAAVLQVEGGHANCVLGNFMRCGLTEALDILAMGAQARLQDAHERATKVQASKTPRGKA